MEVVRHDGPCEEGVARPVEVVEGVEDEVCYFWIFQVAGAEGVVVGIIQVLLVVGVEFFF